MTPEQLEEVLDEYESRLIGYSMTIVGDIETARDVAQDTFLRLWNQEQTPEALKAWLFTACRNRSIDHLRKEKRVVKMEPEQFDQVEETAPDPAKTASAKDTHARVLQFIDRLSSNQQEVIRLRFDSDLSYREISKITGLTEGNVGFLLHSGLKKLRESLLAVAL